MGNQKRGKMCNWRQTPENMQLVPGGRGKCNWFQAREKHATVAKRRQMDVSRNGQKWPLRCFPSAGKTSYWCQARENVPLMPSAGKTCYWCQAREKMLPVPSAGKRASGTKRGQLDVSKNGPYAALPFQIVVSSSLFWPLLPFWQLLPFHVAVLFVSQVPRSPQPWKSKQYFYTKISYV